jgi:hypothetical protein
MKNHVDIISELIEFANQNWVAFTMMLEDRGYDAGKIDEDIKKLEEDVYSL